MKTFDWSATTYRIFAVGNLLFVVVGLVFLIPTAFTVATGTIEDASTYPHFGYWFWTMFFINIGFLTLLLIAAIHLFHLRPTGVTICNIVFVGELSYFLAIGLLWFYLSNPSGIAGATGIGNMGVSPQVICGYPLVALVCLNLARRKRKMTLTSSAASSEVSTTKT
jgi:hypothetical protein